MSLVYSHTHLSLGAIGRLFDRDHTTIVHVVKKTGAKRLPPEPKPPAPPKVVKPRGKVGEANTNLQKAVKRAYANGVHRSAVAEAYGCNPQSVNVIACRLGIKRAKTGPKSKGGVAE